MNANTRIQWLHKKIALNSYPNAQRLAERFGISHRQAQRDLDYLRRELEAPIAYDNRRKGFYYTAPFTLPLLLTSDNDELYIPEILTVKSRQELAADESIIQMQIPYSATVEIPNKLAALELDNYIISREPRNRYICEFHSIEKFIGRLLSVDADFRLIEPAWLRERIVSSANRVLKNNEE
ncbi:MAG: hypothetical protein IJX62_05380 [Clostridia bacterium]|nr:hypothetical protein [Clostridia bacterium]